MKYIKLFDKIADFESVKDTLDLPNVSLIQETNSVSYLAELPKDYSKEYLTFEAIEDSTFKLTEVSNRCYYSLDEGITWKSLSSGANTPTVSAGNKIMFKIANPLISKSYGIGKFSSTGKFNVSGNIMSMLYGDDFVDKIDLTSKNYAFLGLFKGCSNIIEAHNLILPATTLADNCYHNMFFNCTSLTTAPELPATELADYCYYQMFIYCSSLTTAPELPATELADYCYRGMFTSCTNLTTAPQLPATTLADNCYELMFDNCTVLTAAPELSATILAYSCYAYMFRGCTNLSNITMLATDISATDCLKNWTKDVASTGTFIKASSMSSLPSGISGIPEGWTVETV